MSGSLIFRRKCRKAKHAVGFISQFPIVFNKLKF